MAEYPKIFLQREKEQGIKKKRHPWLFSHSISGTEGADKGTGNIPNGGIVDVYLSDRKTFFGRGYFNHHSQIRVRLLTRDVSEMIDGIFFERRLSALFEMRKSFINEKETNAYRIVFGESDSLPGLILDRYGDVYVLQIHTAGMDALKPVLIPAILKVFKPKTLYERSDVNVRLQEGLKECPRQHLFGEKITGEIKILENGIPFYVDVVHGQKTGFFLDQRENRKALQKYSSGRTVLNCFSYTGGFSVYAALAGARSVTSVDVSKDALETAKRNFTLNNIRVGGTQVKHEVVEEDVFDYLDSLLKKKSLELKGSQNPKPFDLIILDPPAFVKNQKTLKNGLAGYLKINEMAIRLLPSNGILITSSCSSRVTDEMFQETLTLAFHRTATNVKVLEIRHQPLDHPFNPDFPEGKYLKFWVCLKG